MKKLVGLFVLLVTLPANAQVTQRFEKVVITSSASDALTVTGLTTSGNLKTGMEGFVSLPSVDTAWWAAAAQSSVFSSVRDNTLTLGWNLNNHTGVPVDPNEPTFVDQWESNFVCTTEREIAAMASAVNGPSFPSTRPIFITQNRSSACGPAAGLVTINLDGAVNFKSSASAGGGLSIEDGGNFLVASGDMRATANNLQWLKQKSTTSTYYALPYVNGNNRTSISVDGIDTIVGGRLGVNQATPVALLDIGGTASPTTNTPAVFNLTATVTPTTNADVFFAEIAPTVITPTGAATTNVRGWQFDVPVITLGSGATLTNGETVYIAGAPSVGSNTYALFVDSPTARSHFAGNLTVGGRYNSTGGDARFGGTVTLPNNLFLQGRNALDNGNINIIRVNASNEIEFSVNVNIGSGATLFPGDIRSTGFMRCVADGGCNIGQSASVGRPTQAFIKTSAVIGTTTYGSLTNAGSGTRFLCVDTNGIISSSATACSGT